MDKWAPGTRVIDVVTREVATILPPPEPPVYSVYVLWEKSGERGWVSKDEVRRIWETG
jgi:hypothetical protein